MKTRLITAAVLVPILLVIAFALPTIVFAVAVALCCAIAAYELLYGTGLVRHVRLVIYCVLTAALIPIWCYFEMPYVWGLLGLIVFVGALFAEMMYSHIKLQFERISVCICAGILIPYLFSSVVRIHNYDLGRYIIIIPMILAFLPDSGAYFCGLYFGKHKLAPAISPKKTVEGAIGGVIMGVLGMLLYGIIMQVAFRREVNYVFAVIYGLLGAAAAIFGDLCFSVIKRQSGIKDFGNLIPGHGGILDRFDSMIVVAPLTEVLLLLLPVVL